MDTFSKRKVIVACGGAVATSTMAAEEIKELERATSWRVDHIKELVVPELDAERCLVYLKRVGV